MIKVETETKVSLTMSMADYIRLRHVVDDLVSETYDEDARSIIDALPHQDDL